MALTLFYILSKMKTLSEYIEIAKEKGLDIPELALVQARHDRVFETIQDEGHTVDTSILTRNGLTSLMNPFVMMDSEITEPETYFLGIHKIYMKLCKAS